jgi:hypothetical protein
MAQPGNPGVRGGYQEVETLDDPGGAHAVISQRIGHNTFTVAFFRKYERDGQKERTAFYLPENFDSLRRLIDTTEARIKELKTSAPASPQTTPRGRR